MRQRAFAVARQAQVYQAAQVAQGVAAAADRDWRPLPVGATGKGTGMRGGMSSSQAGSLLQTLARHRLEACCRL